MLEARTQLSFLLALLRVAQIWLLCLLHGDEMRGPCAPGSPAGRLAGWEGPWGFRSVAGRWESITSRKHLVRMKMDVLGNVFPKNTSLGQMHNGMQYKDVYPSAVQNRTKNRSN